MLFLRDLYQCRKTINAEPGAECISMKCIITLSGNDQHSAKIIIMQCFIFNYKVYTLHLFKSLDLILSLGYHTIVP